ncbi:MAG TPA: xanthine dehydrogenase family protein molybdopterin-binding subunit [Vicinamibacterales bacterium]|jgi:xanthine dehydrogenase molybdenum-binding subunit|nr:xanthine dehydrogenase family protein molybdopterin-binding subunit [Vicinamibacterales bacterium]
MADSKLVGRDYTTPDLRAKVTGRSKYAEDFRAEGMLFTKLLLSPFPHARVKSIDSSAALAMPGVRAILTADEVPGPRDQVSDAGVLIKANPRSEKALTNEPMYQGEPVLAVAAVDELTAAEAIERLKIKWERLPHSVDPVASLLPGASNPRVEGNVWIRPTAPPGQPAPIPEVIDLKWTQAEVEEYNAGRLPMGKDTDPSWSYGDLDAGFKKADVVLDETFVTPNTSHQCLESRTSMAYWQNGKLFIHLSTQSTVQTVMSVSRWLDIKPEDIVLVSEYCGGGYGSKGTGSVTDIIPALLAKKTGQPVQMRVSREEEHGIGGARPAVHGRMKIGLTKDGRITALDMFTVVEGGPYGPGNDGNTASRFASLLFQPEAMRWRGVTAITNTPPRRAQSQPGGMQGIVLMEPLIARCARKLGVDQVEIRKINAPAGKAKFGPADARGNRTYSTSCFVKEALDKGAQMFRWDERKARSGVREGNKVRGSGVAISAYNAGSVGFDGLFIIKPDGKMYVQTGIGNLGTESFSDCQRVAAEMMSVPWEKVVLTWGDTSRNLPWSCVSGGSQTTHAMTRAAHAVASDGIRKLQQIAAQDFGGRPEDYVVANERVARRGGGPGMTFAHAAQRAIELGGTYDGHEVPDDVNAFTKRAAAALTGQGLMAVAKDKYPRDGTTLSFVAAFAEVEADVETGVYRILDYLCVADVGTVIHPASLGGQVLGRSILGIGHALGQRWVYDQAYGVPLARRFYQNKPPTILDVPAHMEWAAVELPDPETPVGARGIGEPPVAAGCCAVLNAISAAVGDEVFVRAPVTLDHVVTALEMGRPTQARLTANV